MSENKKNIVKAEDIQEVTPERVVERVQIYVTEELYRSGFNAELTRKIEDFERDIYYYTAGLNREIPESWERFKNELDPEYQEFLRLEKKFGKDRVNRSRTL